ncbi:hypothetical protein BKA66DRAFT_442266 [Pyrenochaeta sp. MPI-SDFR-AT-0127]|nr:hypothetical protein BKA66DRAFT_442266 [Pyrenochaeta sp. MPI-SDFR-AT-0127]
MANHFENGKKHTPPFDPLELRYLLLSDQTYWSAGQVHLVAFAPWLILHVEGFSAVCEGSQEFKSINKLLAICANDMRALVLVTAAAGAVAEASQYGHSGAHPVATAMVSHAISCAELPELCTGHVMMYGVATTLTYLCPQKTKVPTTVHVTVTATTTVTADPTIGASVTSPKNASFAEEPITTTTIKSTLTQYKTVTIVNKPGRLVVPSPTPAAITFSSSSSLTLVSTLTPPVITAQFSQGIPPAISTSVHLPLLVGNGTNTQSATNSTKVCRNPLYTNATIHNEHGNPNINVAREVRPTSTLWVDSESTDCQSMAGQATAPFITLCLGLMAVVYLN